MSDHDPTYDTVADVRGNFPECRNPSVRDLVKIALGFGGYDGLFSSDGGCACDLADLMPCDGECSDCEAGYKIPCPGPQECDLAGDCEFHIVRHKESDDPGGATE